MTRVCTVEDVPEGSTRQVIVDGRALLLCHGKDGIYAIDDTCPHEDVSLSLGAFDGNVVRCPLHGSRFCIRSGAVLDPPAETPLTTYTLVIDDGWVHVQSAR